VRRENQVKPLVRQSKKKRGKSNNKAPRGPISKKGGEGVTFRRFTRVVTGRMKNNTGVHGGKQAQKNVGQSERKKRSQKPDLTNRTPRTRKKGTVTRKGETETPRKN